MPSSFKAHVVNFGCRLNAYESSHMAQFPMAQKDTVIINSCAVTKEAVRQVRQKIRQIRRQQPKARIVVTGCAVETDLELFTTMPEVDDIVKNSQKTNPNAFTNIKSNVQDSSVNANSAQEKAQEKAMGFLQKPKSVRAFLAVQTGCDHRCTFCVIPYGRGNAQSFSPHRVITEARALLARGVKEIVLTGVDITSYKYRDAPTSPRAALSLAQLIKKLLHEVPDLTRLRLSSIDVAEIDEDMAQLLINEPRIMPHIHLSLQAGCDLILKRMKRRHLRKDVIKACHLLRQRQDIVFGADFIVGFPTEKEDMFAQTLDLVRACNLTWLHVFPFSARPQTPAARMPAVEPQVIKQRAQQLRDLGARQATRFLQTFRQKRVNVLFETPQKGHSDHFAPVHLLDDTLTPGHHEVLIVDSDSKGLMAKKIPEPVA